jgi:hypothetical protein
MKNRTAANTVNSHPVNEVYAFLPSNLALTAPVKKQRVLGSICGKPSHPTSMPILVGWLVGIRPMGVSGN